MASTIPVVGTCNYDHVVGKASVESLGCYTDAELKAEVKRRKKVEIQTVKLEALEEELARRKDVKDVASDEPDEQLDEDDD